MLSSNGETRAVEARFAGATHRLEIDSEVRYSSPRLVARLEPESLAPIDARPGEAAMAEGEVVSLEACATMYVVLQGLDRSMPQIPTVPATGAAATRITHPGYED